MTRYLYIGGGAYLQGLPMQDLDDELLTKEQKILLETGVTMKLYETFTPPQKTVVKKTEVKDESGPVSK